jgi:hypothetical protein
LLIYQVGNLIEIIFNGLPDYKLGIDLECQMANNNSNNNLPSNSNDNVPRGNSANLDVPRMVRYISANLAALSAIKPIGRAVGLILANGGNILADVLSNEEKANYWIDQFNFYNRYRRFRGGQDGSGPFERGTYPLDNYVNTGSSETSKYLPEFDLFKDLFSPVEHSIPLGTLINVHFISILCLFVMIFCLVILILYLFINIII